MLTLSKHTDGSNVLRHVFTNDPSWWTQLQNSLGPQSIHGDDDVGKKHICPMNSGHPGIAQMTCKGCHWAVPWAWGDVQHICPINICHSGIDSRCGKPSIHWHVYPYTSSRWLCSTCHLCNLHYLHTHDNAEDGRHHF